MRIAAILIALVTTASASPASLKDVFARIAARQPLPQVCFAATPDRGLIACLGTTDGTGKALYFFHVFGELPEDGATWLYFLQNDAAHPGAINREHLDDAAKYLEAHGLRPTTFDFIPLQRRDGATAKVGTWTIRRVLAGTNDVPNEHLEIVCGASARPVDSSSVLDIVFGPGHGPIDIVLASLTRDDVLVVTTEHASHTTNKEASRFNATALCSSRSEAAK